MVFGEKVIIKTKGFSDILNITGSVQSILSRSKIDNGIVSVSAIGSTASVTTIEHEPALVEDMKDMLEKFAPKAMRTRHAETWGDDNGFSHLRASLMGPGITLPFSKGRLIIGTWQQIVVVDHDNRPRNREIFVQVVGD